MRLRVHAHLFVLAAACTPPAPRIAWTIDFAEGAPRPPEVTAVRAWIRSGGCMGGAEMYSAILTPGGPMAPTPPPIADGTWGFGADALDGNCLTVARACEEVVVPSASAVTLLLESVAPSGGCAPPMFCVGGTCVIDGGGGDAGGGDAGGRDAGSRDAGTDAGPPAESACDNGGDDDSDTLIDCLDPDCDGRTCATGGRCAEQACCFGCVSGGRCVPGTGWANCGTGGDACTRCPDCVACIAGACGTTPAAGNACSGGTCIGTTTPTCCTGCLVGDIATGTCQPGTSPTVCGNGGDACTACAAGTICTAQGDCCGGCLTSTGACRTGTSELQCGTGGELCFSCSGASMTCCDNPTGNGGICQAGGC